MTTLPTTPTTPSPHDAIEPHGEDHVHLIPPFLLLAVFGGLFIFTLLTVAATYFNLGPFNIWIALIIATTKASLVLLYFMHLRYDSPFYSIIIISALVFVIAFIGGATVDSLHYRDTFTPPYSLPTP